jgi:Fur family peroxide stress response transcriptional regulator
MKHGAEYLKECGVKPSMQRLAIYKYVAEHPTHPTADEIYEALRDQIPTLSKTTVYNTMKLFVSNGVVDEVFIDRTSERFDGNTMLHAHFMCEMCSGIFDSEIDNIPSVAAYVPKGAELHKTQVLYYGVCPECLRAKAE